MDDDPHEVVVGTYPVNALFTRILFDTGATHSFINPATASRLACHLNEMSVQLSVVTPIGYVYHTEYIVRGCPIVIQSKTFLAIWCC